MTELFKPIHLVALRPAAIALVPTPQRLELMGAAWWRCIAAVRLVR